jgi:hypothetical protein
VTDELYIKKEKKAKAAIHARGWLSSCKFEIKMDIVLQ